MIRKIAPSGKQPPERDRRSVRYFLPLCFFFAKADTDEKSVIYLKLFIVYRRHKAADIHFESAEKRGH